jgi:molybdenum cofactor biosynthesis enzyme MoaA
MSEEVFDKVLKLLPLVPDQSFFISCAFEPLLHPRFTDLLKRIPANEKSKGFFTTNLTIPLSNAAFEDLSLANINHINISLDSLDPATFETLRLRGKYPVFQKQLETLASVFRKAANPPKLRYITMAFKQNFHEISTLVQLTHQNYLAYEHEIRLPFDYTQMDPRWKATSMISLEEWNYLESTIPKFGYRVKFMNPCYEPFSDRTYNA